MIIQLIEKMKQLGPVSPALEERIYAEAFLEEYSAGSIILHHGEVCSKISLIATGITRTYHISDGNEITSHITGEGEIFTAWISYYKQQPSEEIVEALEATRMVSLSADSIEQLYLDFPDANLIGRKQVETALYLSEKRTQMMRDLTATERFKLFVADHPGLLSRVPMKHIASYLDMSEETLSRVRAKIYRRGKEG